MADHKTLDESELHEPKGMSLLVAGVSDVGKVVVSAGDGTSETRKLDYTEIDNAPAGALLGGTYFDDNLAATTIDVATELKENYLIGAATTQAIVLQLPDPAVYTGDIIVVKRLDANHGDGSSVTVTPFAAETIEGAASLSINQQGSSLRFASDGTNWHIVLDYYPKKFKHGWFNYNDLATATTPIAVAASTRTVIPNDTLGPATLDPYPPEGITDVWDAVNGQFDWTQLEYGDTVDIRLDLEVTTSAANQEVEVDLDLGIGGTVITIPMIRTQIKTAGSAQLVRYNGIFMGAANTLDNPAKLYIESPNSLDLKVNGWYVRVIGEKTTF